MHYKFNKDGSVTIPEKVYYKIHKDYRGFKNIMGIPVPTMLVLNPDTQATELRFVRLVD